MDAGTQFTPRPRWLQKIHEDVGCKGPKGDLPEANKVETVKSILVIGGGISGMKAGLLRPLITDLR